MQDGKYVILYIDDDQDYLDAVRTILESNGYGMAEALSAEEGLREYRNTDPDFVIVDLMMEEVDAGTSFVKELRALGNTAPIYMLSSVGDNLHLNTDCAALGLDGRVPEADRRRHAADGAEVEAEVVAGAAAGVAPSQGQPVGRNAVRCARPDARLGKKGTDPFSASGSTGGTACLARDTRSVARHGARSRRRTTGRRSVGHDSRPHE